MVVTSCRQGAADLIEKAEIAPGERFVKPLPEALPQGERTLQGLAGAVDLPGIRADDPEPVRGRGLALRFGQLPHRRSPSERQPAKAWRYRSTARCRASGVPVETSWPDRPLAHRTGKQAFRRVLRSSWSRRARKDSGDQKPSERALPHQGLLVPCGAYDSSAIR
jgi:hypothetical protein